MKMDFLKFYKTNKACKICKTSDNLVSQTLEVCLNCIREKPKETEKYIVEAHKKSRSEFDLPPFPPKAKNGAKCKICVNECQIPLGEKGFCGLRTNEDGNLKNLTGKGAVVQWYYDRLPTNCVADWVCPGCANSGYPKYSYSKGPEYGYKNLAVFFGACSFDCLFCQNWHFRYLAEKPTKIKTVKQLVDMVDSRTSCICYFGGDPTPQMNYAIKASKLALEKNKDRILRICWETNGSMKKSLLKKAVKLSLESGGCIKFDLKTFNENLNKALTGVTNKRTLENFEYVASFIKERPDPPLLIASTLIVPGYIDEKEVSDIANFISDLNPEIPYALLGFYPHFYMHDLPLTKREHAFRCKEVAEKAGLSNVKIGNLHLLS